MFWGTIHRMILIELLKIFVLALCGLTGIILLAGIISEAMKNGFGPMQILACIPLLLPSLLPYTVPTTTLFTTCIVYGRLSADNEIIALKAAGVHILHVVWPAVFLGMATSVVTMVLFLDVIPVTGCLLRNQVVGDVEELLYTILHREGCINHPKITWEIHVKSIQGRKLQDVIFKRKSPAGGFDTIACAKEAELRVDIAHNRILVDMRQCQVLQGENVGFVDGKVWPAEIPPDFGGANAEKQRAMDMTWTELSEYEAKAQREKVEISQEIETVGMSSNRESVPRLIEDRKIRNNRISSIHAEWWMRPALSFGCLCFALVGCPMGIWFSKSDYLSAFITCFLPIVVVYYPMMFCMFDLARAGRIPPWLTIPDADTILLMAGGILFWRLSRS